MIKKYKLYFLTIGLALLTAIIFWLTLSSKQNNFLKNYKEPVSSNTILSSRPISVVGDLQRTSFYERIIGREQNDNERRKIVSAIADGNPAAVIILGDMVFDGSSKNEWKDFDSLISPIKEKRIPVFPVVGNHEYWGNNNTAMKNLVKQFPNFYSSHWYTVNYDSIALIFLDSNESDLTEEGWKLEHDWLTKTVAKFDASKSIKA